MHFINPYISFYTEANGIRFNSSFPFWKEVTWNFLKNLNNQLGLFQHRVNITLVNTKIQTGTRRFGSIFDYKIKVDEHLIYTLPENEKRDFLLEIIYEAFSALAKEYAFDSGIIEQTYQKAKQENRGFNFQSLFKLSSNRKYRGALALELAKNNLLVFCAIQDKSSTFLHKIKLLETDEDNFSWYRRIKEYGWYDNYRFGLKFLNGDFWIVYDIQNKRVEEIICSQKYSLKDIENFKREIGTQGKTASLKD